MSESDRAELRVLIVDDEPLARDFVRGAIEPLGGVRVAGECADGAEAIEAIRREPPDLVLLDVQMPEVDGFDVIEAVGADGMPEVVFVTAYEQYTLRAFEVHALDYVLKPFDPDRLRTAVEHAGRRVEAGRQAALRERLEGLLAALESRGGDGGDGDGEAGPYARTLTVRDEEQIRFVPLEDVDWIEAAGNYVRLHVGGESHTVRSSLKGLLRRLDPARFIRIHRSAIVNLDRIREVHPWFSGDYLAVLDDGQKLRVSRTFRDGLLALTH